MKRLVILAVLITVLVTLFSVTGVAAQQKSREWIVFSDATTTNSAITTANVQIAGGRISRSLPQIGASIVESDDSNFGGRMAALGLVAAPNRRFSIAKPTIRKATGLTPATQRGQSNPFFPLQWSLTAVKATEGWREGRRGEGVQVAVLDEGFYLNLPEVNWNTRLAASFVPGEGVQFYNPDPDNQFSHGTFVSSIIAAKDNDFGTVGVAPKAQIIPVKVLSEQLGYGEDSWVIGGILYAVSAHVDVINMSLGGECDFNQPPLAAYDCGTPADIRATQRLYNQVVRFARNNGVTVIAAAGNESLNFDTETNLIELPGGADGVIAVSATGPVGFGYRKSADPRRPALYSNLGHKLIDFAAPGGSDILFYKDQTSICTVAGFTEPCFLFDWFLEPAQVEATSGGALVDFYFGVGTSFASPTVAGIAAQIIGANGGQMKPERVEQQLKRYAQRLSPIAFYGNGFAQAN